jgi:putative tricarboxylic transport membrane protein
MKAYDQTSGLFWLLLSICVCLESLRLGIGTLRNPGLGFMTVWTSVILGALSLALFFQARWRKEEPGLKPSPAGLRWKRVLLVLLVLVIYSVVMPTIGYLISTFILMGFLFWILKRTDVWRALLFSVLATLVTYYVFSKWLNCQFPDGLFGL